MTDKRKQSQALPWIKLWTAVVRHPKIQRLERELDIRDALGVVVRLWCWTADYCPGGEVPESYARDIGRAASGDTGLDALRVTQACVTCGLLDKTSDGFRVHDWHEMQTVHVEAMEKRKEQARERQRRFRSKDQRYIERDITRDVTRDKSVTSLSPSPSPSPSRSHSNDETITETVPTTLDADALAVLRLLPAKSLDLSRSLSVPPAAVDQVLEDLRGKGMVRLSPGLSPVWELA